MQKKSIELNVILNSVRSKVDHSLSMNLATPELDPTEMAEIMNLQGINLNCRIIPLDEQNVPEVKIKGDLEQKTPSQRLRAVLFVLWEQEGRKGEFEDMYKNNMEKFINLIKDKLD